MVSGDVWACEKEGGSDCGFGRCVGVRVLCVCVREGGKARERGGFSALVRKGPDSPNPSPEPLRDSFVNAPLVPGEWSTTQSAGLMTQARLRARGSVFLSVRPSIIMWPHDPCVLAACMCVCARPHDTGAAGRACVISLF